MLRGLNLGPIIVESHSLQMIIAFNSTSDVSGFGLMVKDCLIFKQLLHNL